MIPVILSGGSGTRLWPVSRASYPKQFCEFYDKSFLRNSIERVKALGEPYILTVHSMQALTWRVAQELNLDINHIIYEPMGKNTAPAIALLCHTLQMQGKEHEVVGVFPADHLIADDQAFVQAVELGVECAAQGEVVTIGIQPRYPATGYGYIEVEDKVFSEKQGKKAFWVQGFREKPDAPTAQSFLTSGKHYWNAGMFIFQVKKMIETFKDLAPDVWTKISAIKADMSNAKYQYANCESISFDYAIMEKLSSQVCIPADMGWSDVGSWDELARLSEEYPSLKSDTMAAVFTQDAHSNYAFAFRNKVIGLIDVDNLLVVDTPDALLIAKKGSSQKVKNLVDQVKAAGLPEATEHPFETRPWGSFEVLADKEAYKAKSIQVDPGAQLSYQSHAQREEHWVIVKGEAEVIIDGSKKTHKPGSYISIPKGAKHRIKNIGSQNLVFIEVQMGSYFGEDDIVRYEDDYQRV